MDGRESVLSTFHNATSAEVDIEIIRRVMGLVDGADAQPSDTGSTVRQIANGSKSLCCS